jgi:hypothetical protein
MEASLIVHSGAQCKVASLGAVFRLHSLHAILVSLIDDNVYGSAEQCIIVVT